ncbi:hypothetical protein [Vitiosangium sp. GDMCC 1.1324]|uniref:hypothetical protein n=1 Tax=Vitiosangium sp. (strain GDMCC 1.1324) TaxID=2138576 RepID=UPI000D376A81|nr:hypothetical protein [Vitiosangium sp. GDMCC 1.1324]PTL82135.1 hypothetical protein DAT35_20255 [Vitiosangium sp. GDMCC 1.1324]
MDGRRQELRHRADTRGPAQATVSFALSQAISGYAYSAVYGLTGGHHLVLFGLGAGALLIAFALDARGQDVRHRSAVAHAAH